MRALALSIGLALGVSGCAGSEGLGRLENTRPVDVATDASVGGVRDGDAGMAPLGEGDEFRGALAVSDAIPACFDGFDNDDDGQFDCSDASCQQNIASCCVGATSDVCCSAVGVPAALPIEDCSGDLSVCPAAGALELFGTPNPRVEVFAPDAVRSFVPGGQDRDTGLLFDERFDPRRDVLRITTNIAVPRMPVASEQIDAVGVGFVDANVNPSTLSRVTPAAGIVVAGNRKELHFVVQGEVVSRFMLDHEPAGTEDAVYTIELTVAPGGRIAVTLSAVGETASESAEVIFPIDFRLRAIAYGRTYNPSASAPPPVRVRSMQVSQSRCDIPSALVRSDQPTVPAPGVDPTWADGVTLRNPSVYEWTDGGGSTQLRMALLVDDAIQLAAPGSGGFELTTTVGSSVLAPIAAAWAAGGVDDPTLRYDGTDLQLWFVAYDNTGHGSIAKARFDTVSGLFENPTQIPGLDSGSLSYEAVAPFSYRSRNYAVIRVREDTGVPGTEVRLALFEIFPTTAVELSTLRQPSGGIEDFDRDEVDGPSVLVDGNVVRLYFAGRRGTRWSLSTIVSSDLEYWNEPESNAMLVGSLNGFDAVAVSDPSVYIDSTAGELQVFYTGSDSSSRRIGVATQPAP